MPELKQPQEAAEKTTEQPLTTKKKRAMLEYMAIMFAAAFLLVAISLLIKVIDMKGEMEAANTGARENIALLQKDLDAARAESAELQTQLAEANAASSEAADKLSEAETRLSEAEKARARGSRGLRPREGLRRPRLRQRLLRQLLLRIPRCPRLAARGRHAGAAHVRIRAAARRELPDGFFPAGQLAGAVRADAAGQ